MGTDTWGDEKTSQYQRVPGRTDRGKVAQFHSQQGNKMKHNKISTTSDLQNTLLDEIQSLRAGATSTKQARSVASLANSIINVKKLELEFGGKPLEVGSNG